MNQKPRLKKVNSEWWCNWGVCSGIGATPREAFINARYMNETIEKHMRAFRKIYEQPSPPWKITSYFGAEQ